jgi:hypothetical protein
LAIIPITLRLRCFRPVPAETWRRNRGHRAHRDQCPKRHATADGTEVRPSPAQPLRLGKPLAPRWCRFCGRAAPTCAKWSRENARLRSGLPR